MDYIDKTGCKLLYKSMTGKEKWPSGLSDMDWETPVPELDNPILQAAMMDIYYRHDYMVKRTNKLAYKHFWQFGHSLGLYADPGGLDLAVRHYDKYKHDEGEDIQIGFYSPADGGRVVLYPEYFEIEDSDDLDDLTLTNASEEEMNLIKNTALFTRMDGVAEFNNKPSTTDKRIDTSHPAIHALHSTHQEYFDTRFDLNDILDIYNSRNPNLPDVYCDSCTRAAIYLIKGYINKIKGLGYTYMGVKVIGGFNRINDTTWRLREPLPIPVAKLDEDFEDYTDFSCLEPYVGSLNLDDFVELAQMVIALDQREDLGGKFSPFGLCVHTGPKANR